MEFEPEAPFIAVVSISALLIITILWALVRWPAGRLDQSRTVLVHASDADVWELVRAFPQLHSRHGKINDFGDLAEWSVHEGDGESAGTVWRARGTWNSSPYWAEVEILRSVPGERLTVRLRRDSLRTQRGLRDHVGSLTLENAGPDTTKLTWHLRARLRGPRLLIARVLSPETLRARLLDVGLRSLKTEIDGAGDRRRTLEAKAIAPTPIAPSRLRQSNPPEKSV